MESDAPDYAANHISDSTFVTDGNVVTSRGAGTAEQFSMEIVGILCGEEAREKLRVQTVQR